MFGSEAKVIREKSLAGLGSVLLLVALLAAYSNHFHNGFHFDDAHTVETNASIREVRNIPMFFRDATTFSSLPSNQSYRPLVSTLLAIDYRLGGLQPFPFHLSIFVLFVALTLLVAFVIHRLTERSATSSANGWIALGESIVPSTSPSMHSPLRNLTEPLIETRLERRAADCVGTNVRSDGPGPKGESSRFDPPPSSKRI
jgi:hypothetical protein